MEEQFDQTVTLIFTIHQTISIEFGLVGSFYISFFSLSLAYFFITITITIPTLCYFIIIAVYESAILFLF